MPLTEVGAPEIGVVASTVPSPLKSHSSLCRPALAVASAEKVNMSVGVPSMPVSECGDQRFIDADGSVTAKAAFGIIVVNTEAARITSIIKDTDLVP